MKNKLVLFAALLGTFVSLQAASANVQPKVKKYGVGYAFGSPVPKDCSLIITTSNTSQRISTPYFENRNIGNGVGYDVDTTGKITPHGDFCDSSMKFESQQKGNTLVLTCSNQYIKRTATIEFGVFMDVLGYHYEDQGTEVACGQFYKTILPSGFGTF